jgi:DNA-directed RNA polymerase subunit RPC12/RpoP
LGAYSNTKGRLPKQKQQVQVDLKQADTIKCSDCNNYLFITSFILKKLSALLSPNGQEALIPVQVYSCGNCGKVAEGMLEGSGVEEEKKSNSFPRLDI